MEATDAGKWIGPRVGRARRAREHEDGNRGRGCTHAAQSSREKIREK
jgi:hypothetical protein